MIKKPEWFNLENYQDLKSFDLAEWYKQINFRWDLESDILLAKSNPHESHEKRIAYRLNAIQNGIVEYDSLDLKYILNHPPKKTVIDLAVFDIFSSSSWIERDAPNEIYSKNSFDELQEKICPNLYSSTANINVDLSASDEQIKKDFSEWLKNKKRPKNSYKHKTNFKSCNLGEWVDLSLLPFIDLYLFFKANEIEVKTEKFAAWLFPEHSEYRGIDRFITVQKRSKWLLNSSTIDQITSLLYSEKNK